MRAFIKKMNLNSLTGIQFELNWFHISWTKTLLSPSSPYLVIPEIGLSGVLQTEGTSEQTPVARGTTGIGFVYAFIDLKARGIAFAHSN